MPQRWMRAQDTFVAQLGDGTQAFVTKGDTLPDTHELVKRDADGSGILFKPLDEPEEAPPADGPKLSARASRAAGKAT
jgi:hypothetical protein